MPDCYRQAWRVVGNDIGEVSEAPTFRASENTSLLYSSRAHCQGELGLADLATAREETHEG